MNRHWKTMAIFRSALKRSMWVFGRGEDVWEWVDENTIVIENEWIDIERQWEDSEIFKKKRFMCDCSWGNDAWDWVEENTTVIYMHLKTMGRSRNAL